MSEFHRLNTWNYLEVGFLRGPQTFIQCCQQRIIINNRTSCSLGVSPLHHEDVLASQTIDSIVRTSQELGFRLITASKNNLTKIDIPLHTLSLYLMILSYFWWIVWWVHAVMYESGNLSPCIFISLGEETFISREDQLPLRRPSPPP